jgi:hypothetical protein
MKKIEILLIGKFFIIIKTINFNHEFIHPFTHTKRNCSVYDG